MNGEIRRKHLYFLGRMKISPFYFCQCQKSKNGMICGDLFFVDVDVIQKNKRMENFPIFSGKNGDISILFFVHVRNPKME